MNVSISKFIVLRILALCFSSNAHFSYIGYRISVSVFR
jgi:hypothetical protein